MRLSQLEEGMKIQQRAMKQLKKDNAEDAKEVKQYLDQVHDLQASQNNFASPRIVLSH